MLAKTQRFSSSLWREDLHERLGWLIRLRWFAVVGLFLTIVFARYVLRLPLSMPPLIAMNALLLVSNAVYSWVLRRWREAARRWLVRFGVLQTIVDYVILVVVLHYSGGIENPMVAMFVFQCIISSMLFTPALSYWLAGLAVLLIGALGLLEYYGAIRHMHLEAFMGSEVRNPLLYTLGVLAAMTLLLFVSVYLATTIETASRRSRAVAARRAVQLEEAREQIQQADKMAALGEVAASMAHDLNNPAGIICSRFDIMEAEGAFDELPERLRTDLGTLRDHAEYLRRIARNWTTFARKSTSQTRRIDLNKAVRRMSAMIAEFLPAHGIQLEINLHEFPLWVYADPVGVQQVVLNLVNNARDAMPDGGTLTIQTRLQSNPPGNDLALLEVRDSGIGILTEDLERIFEPFFSRKSEGEGTGLGLSICQKIVKEMDGRIAAKSEVGKGTTISVEVPISDSFAGMGEDV